MTSSLPGCPAPPCRRLAPASLATVARAALLTLVPAAPLASQAPSPPPPERCDVRDTSEAGTDVRDAMDAGAWASAFRDRVASYDGLYAFAAGVYGAPEQCHAAITMHFDGVAFGLLTLTFVGGETLVVETMPPQVGIIELRVPSGFADEPATRAALRAYTAARGLMIDWSTPETATASDTAAREGETTRTFRDPDPGLNGSATLVFDRERLVAVRVAMAP